VTDTDSAGNSSSTSYSFTLDATAPTATLSSAVYSDLTGVLSITGANLNTLGVSNGTDVKTQLDWTKIVWDINGDGATTANATFVVGDITSAVVTNATTLTVTLASAAKTTLEAMTGFGAAGNADKLSVTAGFIKDTAGNIATTDVLSNGSIVTDTTAPTSTLTSAAYNGSTGVLTVTGTNLNTLGVANGTDVKAQLDWAKIVWDINGDGATTADKTFALSDITSAVVTNATTLTVTLTVTAKAALEGTTGFSAAGGADKLSVTAGFIKDTAGNAATTDALSSGAITITGIATRSVSYSTTTFNEAGANDGSITMTSTVTLTGDTFAGTNGVALTGVTAGNVPNGLTLTVTKASSTTATVSLSGNATAHANVNDIANLTVTFGDAAFTGGNAAGVTGATNSGLRANFADSDAMFNGTALLDVLNGNAKNDIIYGGGGPDVINGGAGNDTIDITDAGATSFNSATIQITSAANGVDTIVGFNAAATASGGDVLDFSAIAGLTDAVATGLTLASDFAASNVFVFNTTPVTVAQAASAIAADVSVVATAGYIVIADSANSNAVTVYHSTDLAVDGTETALAIMSGVNIADLTAANFIV
jgi:formylmethanofuran dehydrogenase subunit D